jgi:hypothetical protein
VRADSLTVSNGALMLSIEITPIEDMEAEGIEVRDSIMELPPVSVLAPGHWYTAVLVDEKHEPMYAELTPVQLAARRERRKGESYP